MRTIGAKPKIFQVHDRVRTTREYRQSWLARYWGTVIGVHVCPDTKHGRGPVSITLLVDKGSSERVGKEIVMRSKWLEYIPSNSKHAVAPGRYLF